MKTMKTSLRYSLLVLLTLLPTLSQAGDYRLPNYQSTVLKNGLTVVLMEQHEVPLIDVRVAVRGGAMVDGTQSGLAGMTASSLLFGAGERTKQELDHQFDFVGASVSARAARDHSQLRASFAVRDLDTILPILADLLLRPTFEAEEFTKYQKRTLAQLGQQKESPRSVIGNYFHKLNLGEHPYASVPEGDGETVASITRDDLAQFHQNWYQPQNTILCVVGDFSMADMLSRLDALFGDWKKGDSTVPEVGPLPTPDQARVLLVDKSDASEATFYIGGPGVALTNPDRVGIRVINTILGGRFTSWLNDELRVNAGLTYGARSTFVSYGQGGLFRISTFTRTATTFETIDLALEVYERLWENGIDKETLASAKAYVKGQFPPRFETSSQLAGLLVQMQLYNYNESFINTFEEKVNSLDLDETKRLINAYFPRENLQMVVVGNAAEIRDGLGKYGELSEVEIQANGFDFE